MKHNLRRVLHLTEARTFWVRAVRAWRNLLPDWTPTLDALRELETMPHEHRAAVAIVSEGWQSNDPRWDVLMALLEWERRQAKEQARRDFWAKPGAFERLMDAVREEQEDEDHPNGFLCQRHGVDDCFCSGAPDYELPKQEPVVIPVKVVQNGHTVSESETTVETPLKAFFLDNVRPIKHLSEKEHAGSHLPSPEHDDVPRA